MLYSKNGEYPTELPFRIVLPSGNTRTDPATFTPEEVTNAGYTPVSDPPTAVENLTISWNGTSWVQTDTRTFQVTLDNKMAELKSYRQFKETDFYFNGTKLFLNEQTQSRLNAALVGYAYNPNAIINWEFAPGVYIDLDKATLEFIALSAWEHIRLCYVNAKALTATIQAATTIAELDAIDLTVGWPT
tara:strand:- start:80808 stop:81371 length:564 start_codon:yes stop_codon:yes gene_type:complete